MDWKAIGALASVIVALVSVAGLMQLTDDMHEPVTDTIRKEGGGWSGGGQFPDPPGDERKYGEVFGSTLIFTSWSATGTSEIIIVGGQIERNDDWIHCVVDKNGYWFYIWDGTGDKTIDGVEGWKVLSDDQIPDGNWVDAPDRTGIHMPSPYDAQMFNFKLDGLYADGATLLVRYRIHCSGFGGGWTTVAADEARLVQGDGDLTWSKDVYTVGIDTHATLSWFVPAVDSDVEDRRAYMVFVTNENTGSIVYEKLVDSKSGSVKIPITEDMAELGGSNRLMARLWNNIFQKDVTHVPMRIDGGFRAPGDEDVDFHFPVLNSITTDKGEYLEGQTVTLTLDATSGTYPISHYYILCEIEGTEMVNTETTSSTYSFQASLAGIVECEATVYDIYGNPSQKRTVRVTSENALLSDFCDLHPDDPACKDTEPGLDWLEMLILALLVVALFALVGFVTWGMSQLGLDMRIMLIIIALTILAGVIAIGMLAADYMKT